MERDAVATFGDLLRRARHGAELSQEELAERAGLSARAISDLERGVNRAPREDTLDMLATALNLSDDERRAWRRKRRQMASRGMPTQEPRVASIFRTPGGLPPRLESFVGRERGVRDLQALLRHHQVRLVTTTGPGGIGKTSLAIEAARGIAAEFRDGARFVSLAPVREPDAVATTTAAALGLQDRGAVGPRVLLVTYLTDKGLLLVMDNFEHVVEAAPLVTDLMIECPGLTVLVTSRAPLRVSGEHEFPVSPLGLPPIERQLNVQKPEQPEAITLFIQRAQQHQPGFQLTASNADAVAEICRQVDGLPLAIELVAAKVKLLSPPALLDRFSQRLSLLADGPRNLPARQQTMRGAIAWSYDLLTHDQQRLFRRLSVFVGG